MKIRALRVEINGKLVAVAGAEKLSLLTGHVGFSVASSGDPNLEEKVSFNVMGIEVGPRPRQLSWGDGVRLGLGDKVTFQIVEVEHPSPPTKVLASPSSEELNAAAIAGRRAAKRRDHDA